MSAARMRALLRELGNEDIAAQAQRFFKTGAGEYGAGDRFLGIQVPAIGDQVKRHRDLPRRVAFATGVSRRVQGFNGPVRSATMPARQLSGLCSMARCRVGRRGPGWQ